MSGHKGCQIFLAQYTKNGEKYKQITTQLPMRPKMYQIAIYVPSVITFSI
jgi:hypothetical protein